MQSKRKNKKEEEEMKQTKKKMKSAGVGRNSRRKNLQNRNTKTEKYKERRREKKIPQREEYGEQKTETKIRITKAGAWVLYHQTFQQTRDHERGHSVKQTDQTESVCVCCLLNVPATGKCISGTDLLRQFCVLPH